MNGFIKVHRSILEWEWWDDINTFRLFMTILLLANWKEKKWHGKVIPRGALWTSLPSLADASGLSVRQTRTALAKLKSTGEVTDEATGEGRLVTVVNYELYQAVDIIPTDEATDDLTGKRQASDTQRDRRATSTEEYKEVKKRKKGESSSGINFFAELMETMEDE